MSVSRFRTNTIKYATQLVSEYVVVSSNSSNPYQPENEPPHRTTRLVNELNFYSTPQVEVGRVSITICPVDEGKGKDTIFGHTPGDKEISIASILESSVRFGKVPGRIQIFVEDLNDFLAQNEFKLSFDLQIRPDFMTYFILKQDIPAYRVKRSRAYMYAFGFARPRYEFRTHHGEKEFSQDLYDSITITHDLVMTAFQEKMEVVKVDESKFKTCKYLISSMNKAFEAFHIFFEYDHKTLTFENE